MNLKDEIGKSKVLLTASSDRLLAGYGDGFSSFFVCTFGRVQVRSLFGQNESLLNFNWIVTGCRLIFFPPLVCIRFSCCIFPQ